MRSYISEETTVRDSRLFTIVSVKPPVALFVVKMKSSKRSLSVSLICMIHLGMSPVLYHM